MQKEIIAIIITVLSFLIFIGIAFIVSAIYSEKKKKKLQESEKMKNQFNQEMLLSQLETQEYSFNQISTELHDNIGQLLSTTKLLLGMTAMELPQPPDTLKTAEQTLAKAIIDLRSLSKTLANGWLSHFSFTGLLEAEKERINACKNVCIQLINDYEELPLEPGEQVILFRVVQDVLQNTIKQLSPKNIKIYIGEKNDFFEIKIEQDSCTKAREKESIIFESGRRRIELLEGMIELKQESDIDLSVIITIPVQVKKMNL